MPGERAIALWTDLASHRRPGWWPVILGTEDDERRLAESVAYCASDPAAILATADTLDTEALLERWKRDNEPEDDEEWDVVGEWPDAPRPNSQFALPYNVLTKQPQLTIVAIVAVGDHAEVPAALGWGGWNSSPGPAEHVAMLRRWSERHGAQLVGLSSDVVEMKVSAPPSSRESAMTVAEEHYAYCSDIVTQGAGTISALGATLLNAPAWYFWWD